MNENQQEKLGAWAIVEWFGHTRIAGYVSEFVVGGAALIRVDVPAVEAANGLPSCAAFTKLYGTGAIYSITFTDEATARRAVAVIRPQPISIYIPTAPALPARQRHSAGEYEDVYDRPDSDFGDEGFDEDDEDEG